MFVGIFFNASWDGFAISFFTLCFLGQMSFMVIRDVNAV